MRVLMLEADPKLLDDRRRKGLDVFDEMWDGVLHLVPPPSGTHQRVESWLLRVLAPLAEARGLITTVETGLFNTDEDYRVPDLAVYRPDNASDRGIDSTAEMALEIRSPDDETDEKVPWYARRAVGEIIAVRTDPLEVEIWRTVDGRPVKADDTTCQAVGVSFDVEGSQLRLTWSGGEVGFDLLGQ